jgi:YVTN family beta-propeller protein
VYVTGITEGAFPAQTHFGAQDAFVRKYDANGNELWTRQFGTGGYDEASGGFADGSGVYVVGSTSGALPGQTSSGGPDDAYIRKYDANGNELWTRQFGTGSVDFPIGVFADSAGVYVGGTTFGTLPGQSNSGCGDVFIRKYDANGSELWTRQFGSSGCDGGVAVSGDGFNVYVAGHVSGALPGQTSSGSDDAFVRKYDTNGNELWTRQFGTSATDSDQRAVSADSSGVYVAGHTLGALPGQTNSGGQDMFVRKYDPSGNEVLTLQLGTGGTDTGYGVAAVSGGAYVAGFVMGALPGQTGAGSADAYVLKLVESPVFTGPPTVFVANRDSNTVSVIDSSTNTVLATIPVGLQPAQVEVSPTGQRVYVTNQGSDTVSVIDVASLTVIATIPVGDGPYGVAASPDNQKVYVTHGAAAAVEPVWVIDVASLTASLVFTLPAGGAGNTATFHPNGTEIWFRNGGGVFVTRRISYPGHAFLGDIGTPTPGQEFESGFDNHFSFVPGTNFLYSAHVCGCCGHFDRFQFAPSILATGRRYEDGAGKGIWTVAAPTGGLVYLARNSHCTAEAAVVRKVSANADSVLATLTISGWATTNAAITPNGTYLYLTGYEAGGISPSVKVVDTVTLTVVATIPVGNNPVGIAISPSSPAPNTPTGSNVSLQPIDSATGATPVTVEFSTVTQSGTTSLSTSSTGPTPPAGFALGSPATYYELTTTAVFSGPVTVCIDYTGTSFTDESSLKLFHQEGGVWVDRTISLNTASNVICASVTSLSPFAIFGPANVPPTVSAVALSVAVNEGQTATNSGSFSDANSGDLVSITASAGTITTTGTNSGSWSWSLATTDGPAQSQTVTISANDGKGGISSTTFSLTVNNVPPAVSFSLSANPINENESVTLSGSVFDPGTLDSQAVVINWGDGTPSTTIILAGSGAFSASHQYLDDNPTGTASDTYNITVTATDKDGATHSVVSGLQVSNRPPVLSSVSGPTSPLALGTAAAVSASFTDAGTQDTHTCAFSWDDGTTTTVAASAGSCSASRTYIAAGVYTVGVTVTDDDTGSATGKHEFVVVYDPSAGFVTGGGWINSLPGAYTPNPGLTGKANFGFVSKYLKGASTPSGQTQFQFQGAGFNFHSSSYQWLVVSGPKAQYKGTGTVNGAGSFGFLLTATDGQLPGGGGVDKFRIKIWDTGTGAVIYDNALGASEDLDAANPQAIGGGSIVIHSK